MHINPLSNGQSAMGIWLAHVWASNRVESNLFCYFTTCGHICPHSMWIGKKSRGSPALFSSERERGHHPEHRKENHFSENDLV